MLVAAGALIVTLTACTNTVSLTAAPAANDPACAAVQVRLPSSVDGALPIRSTNAQSTAAWGSPVAVVYHCGVPVPVVSDLPCFTLGPINWIRDDRGKAIIYTTFGRSPAVQVVINPTQATSSVLQDIGSAVNTLPRNSSTCLAPAAATTPQD